ncbi:MAG: glycyl radical protein [Anaerolineales bacterium]|nr:glycyl radical protein [Anaerolineales bacterium]
MIPEITPTKVIEAESPNGATTPPTWPAGSTERVYRLREELIHTTPSLCAERGLLVTEAYEKYQADPPVLRRARALAHTLANMSIYIAPGEVIVGNQASAPRAAPLFPEYLVDFLAAEIDEFPHRRADVFTVSPEVKAHILNTIVPSWHGKTLNDRVMAIMPEDVAGAQKAGVISGRGNITSGDGHIILNLEKVLAVGLEGIIAEAEAALTGLSPYEAANFKRRPFLQGAIITLRATIDYAHRYAAEAERQAVLPNTSPERRAELEKIAAACRQVPAKPPRTFQEAVQSAYLVHLVSQIESNGHSFSLGRFDQYTYPYYEADRQAGRLTREQALEILELLWLKLFSIIKVRPWDHTRFGIGYPTYQNVTIGGQTETGQDATNELSFMVLETIRNVRLTQPNVSARIHTGTSDRFLLECAKTIKLGFGMPAMKNDEIIIPALLEKGVTPADAYNYAIVGCIEAAVPGKWGYRVTGMSFLNILKIVELTLNNGVDPKSGLQLLPGRGNLAAFTSFEELYQAFYEQYMFYARTSFHLDAVADISLEELVPDAFCSALVDDCLKRGLTVKEGGPLYDVVSGLQSGVTNVANALMALRKLVFEEKKLSAAEVMAALAANFENEGGEVVRQRLLHAPKYGNDLDEVDELARRVMQDYQREMAKYHHSRYGRGPIGGGYAGSTSNISANVPLGSKVGATPDGRKAGEPIAEGMSAMHGTDTAGPTAILRSISKLPNIKMLAQLLNLRLSPTTLADEAGLKRLVTLLKGFRNLKVWHVQFNTIDTATLLAAQKNPEQYRDLVVRVAGYSALFVTLDKATQDDIIRRTVHELN